MNNKKQFKFFLSLVSVFTFALIFSVGLTSIALAKEKIFQPEQVSNSVKTEFLDKNITNAINYNKYLWYFNNEDKNGLSNSLSATYQTLLYSPIATVTVFSDSDQTGSSGGSSNYYGHAFITVKNNSGSNISVGKLSGIQPNKTVSVGTWGNKSEHTGLWYDLESYFVNQGAYSGRVSASYIMNSSELSTLNSTITNGDYWSLLSNCSTFAKNAWNSVVPSSYDLSAGYPNTPASLASSIQSVFPNYSTNASIPYDYLVYYANGTASPIRSSIY